MNEHASRFALERHRLGESEPATATHLESCEACRETLRLMEADDRAFMIARPTLRSIGVEPKKRRPLWLPALALAASIAAVALIPRASETRMKGTSHVELMVRRGADTFPYSADRPLRRGDTLVFRYTSLRRHMLLAGIEASGEVSIFVSNVDLVPGQNQVAAQGIELDDYLGEERVIALLSDEPLDRSAVEQALKAQAKVDPLRPPKLDYDADQASWLIEKEHP